MAEHIIERPQWTGRNTRRGSRRFARGSRETPAPLVDREARGGESRPQQATAASRDPRATGSRGLAGLVGRSAALMAALDQASLAAPLDVNVLILGESGTGKSMLARAIHGQGPRRTRALVELNCAALPESLLESELFGAVAGAHSTATKDVPGKVAAAEGGTLFLDEISELSPAAQAKLLQLLESKCYYPLGSTRPIHADVRLIAASNVDLDALVAAKRFRADLLYRLNVLPIRLPALSERREDVPCLAEHLRDQLAGRHSLARLPFTGAALQALQEADWPGNVRQLANAVEAGLIRATGGGTPHIDLEHLFPGPAATPAQSLQEATHRFKARFVRRVLEDTGWDLKEAAARLDVSRSTLYGLIRRYELERERKA